MISVRHLALAVAVAALSGCGGNSESPTVLGPTTPTPPTTVASTLTPSPSATASSGTPGSTATATIDERTRDELLRTPVEYYEAIERAYITLDYAPVEALSSKECGGCQAQIKFLKEAEEKKYVNEGGKYTVTDERLLGPVSGGKWAVGLTLAYTELIVRDAAGSLVDSADAAENRRKQVNLIQQDGRWVIANVYGVDS